MRPAGWVRRSVHDNTVVDAISSRHNPKIKALRKLRTKRERERTGRFAAEAEDLLAEALRFGRDPVELYVAAGAELALDNLPEDRAEVDPDVLAWASSLGSGTRVIGVWPKFWGRLEGSPVVVYLEGAADPGNVGTIVRAMHAFAEGVVALGPGCADPFSPKAVRASMGSIFARPPIHATFAEVAAHATTTVGLAPRAGKRLDRLEPREPVALCLGAERAGLRPELADRCTEIAHLPMLAEAAGGAESLNVAMAGTVALYELRRIATCESP